jgi:uncharacterized membrane protein YbhN (UPF0104 family)
VHARCATQSQLSLTNHGDFFLQHTGEAPRDRALNVDVIERRGAHAVTAGFRIPRWLKASVGLMLLLMLTLNLEWSRLYDGMHTLRWPLIGAAALLYPVALLCNAWKWSAALRLHDLSFRISHLLRVGCIGFFVNNLLPSAIGGDVYRV